MRGLLKSKPDALGDIGGLMKKFKGVPRAVLLDLNEKFTESVRGVGKCGLPPALRPFAAVSALTLPLPLPISGPRSRPT